MDRLKKGKLGAKVIRRGMYPLAVKECRGSLSVPLIEEVPHPSIPTLII